MSYRLLALGLLVVIVTLLGITYLQRPLAQASSASDLDPWLEPVQEETGIADPFQMKIGRQELTIRPLAAYQVTARILSKHEYSSGWEGKLAPFDLALGWGTLSEQDIGKRVKFSQWDRFYFFKIKPGYAYSEDYVYTHSSNHHLIPATSNLKRALRILRRGDLIKLEGYLVNVSGRYGKQSVRWNSSLTRMDRGNGACELLYVTSLTVGGKIFN
ncbi:MAG: hypothetical protein JW784_04585 [Candidatus Cloacimonetes bacterium]|nr:hypothetical protein [Candidatus Cloacimonadota bacterium]